MKPIEVILLKRHLIVILTLLMALMLLVSCSSVKPGDSLGGGATTSTQQTVSTDGDTPGSTETPGTTVSGTDETSTPTTDKPVTDSTETTGTTETPGTTVPPTTDPPSTTKPPITTEPDTSTPPVTTPPTTEPDTSDPPVTNPPETEPSDPKPTYVPSSSVSAKLVSYSSNHEAKPYIKGDAIYSILYKGSRAQVGDTLVYELSVLPADHGDTVFLSATDNLSCTLSGSCLTVKVLRNNDISTGRITIYTAKDDRSPVSTSVKISFVIDEGGDPYEDMLTVISQYVAVKGMVCTDIGKGYTYSDPSSSITGYEGAPAWDDQILKSDSVWKEKCLWLIDEYAKRGFTKVSFIETSSAFGFSAAQ